MSDEDCPICITSLFPEDGQGSTDGSRERFQCLGTRCLHHFHQGCLSLWLQKQRTCPMCRSGVKKGDLFRVTSRSGFISRAYRRRRCFKLTPPKLKIIKFAGLSPNYWSVQELKSVLRNGTGTPIDPRIASLFVDKSGGKSLGAQSAMASSKSCFGNTG